MPDLESPSPLRINEFHSVGPDFTVYQDEQYENELSKAEPVCSYRADNKKKEYHPYSGPLIVEGLSGAKANSRALACRAYRGKFWSITLRCEGWESLLEEKGENTPEPQAKYLKSVRKSLTEYLDRKQGKSGNNSEAKNYSKVKLKGFLGYCPGGYPDYEVRLKSDLQESNSPSAPDSQEKAAKLFYLNEIYTLCKKLDGILFQEEKSHTHPSGLIAITGATDSSKSLIARGMIFLSLQRAAELARIGRQRRPHLITYEDPIEKYYIQDPATQTVPGTLADLEYLLNALYIDYTPREKDTVESKLKAILKDALRQTPAVLFVGETREKEDWRELLQFAGSGHLVITTSHSSSVLEAISGIFRDTDTKTPSRRSEIARRLLGIVNIRSYTVTNSDNTNIRALLPALWKRTSYSINDLTADGLASILPARYRGGETGCLGRTYFAECLTDDKKVTKEMKAYPGKNGVSEAIKKKAKEWDLEGI